MSTATTAYAIPFRENKLLQRLSMALLLWMAYTALHPVQVFDYWLENVLTIAFVGILGATYRRLALSDLSYSLLFLFLALHIWGAQYKYSEVPFGEWLREVSPTDRHPYDRFMHLAYGLLTAYPMQEWFMRSVGVMNGFRYFLPIQFTLACSAVYELLEAFMASILSPERGEEFVGMQGDIWDAQKDMFLAAVGAVAAMAATAFFRRFRQRRPARLSPREELVQR